MHTGFELIGKPIFGITDGKQIGEIKDLYLDQTLKKVVYIKISQAGLFGRKVQLVHREDVVVFGVDSTLPEISMSSTTL